MPSCWTLFLLTITYTYYHDFSEARSLRSPSTVIVGTVHCDTCRPNANHVIAGASVGVECNVTNCFRKEVKTNILGEFQVHLPFHAKDLRRQYCRIRLVRSNEASCSVPATAPSSSLHLMKSRNEGHFIFSAGLFSFRPEACDEKNEKVKKTDQLPFLPNPLNPPLLPPNPLLPPPSILPPLNPFQPPPSVIPPIFPTPPPSIFPPMLPLPPTPPFNLPPLPGLVPSPPPPTPTFPIPLPPFPFQPTPGFPGVPPADVSSHSRTTSP